jgi:hypothetical protein
MHYSVRMTDEKLKEHIMAWAKRDGEHIVKGTLVMRRLSTSLVEKVLRGRYEKQISGAVLTVLLEELERAGVIEKSEAS